MHPTPLSVLMAGASPAEAGRIAEELRLYGFLPEWNRVESEIALFDALREDLDVIIADCALPAPSPARIVEALEARGADVPVIVVVEPNREADAIDCVRHGIADYLFSDRLARLGPAVERALDARRLRAEKRRADDERSALLYALGERVKELTLLQRVAALLQDDPQTTPGLLQTLAGLLPPAYRWPAIAAARVRAGELIQETEGFRETAWMQRAAFTVAGTEVAIEIAYLEPPPDPAAPFLKEEEALLSALGDMLRAHFERRAAVDDLKASREHFRRLIEHTSDVISILSPDGIIRYESPAAERVLGCAPEDMQGRSVLAFVHPDDQPRMRALFEQIERGRTGPAAAEYRFRHREGRWLVLESIATPLVEEGRLAGSVMATRDVTERKTLEQQLRQAQKMEAVGRLAGGIAHDFNNLLTAIVGYAELLLAALPEQDEHRADVMEIQNAGRRAAALTRQLLAFSRKQVTEPTLLDLNSVVHAMESMLRRLIGDDVELVTELGAASGRIFADAGQVDQVLMNLAVNARDAMEEGGRLLMRTRDARLTQPLPVRDGPLPPGDYVQLTVTDSGSGMTDEVKAHLFEPFFTTKEQGRGTGLGLATIYGIVKQAGGGIRVDSQPGLGTTFDIFFPAAGIDGRARQEEAGQPGNAGNAQGTILLVEDEDAVRQLASTVLRRRGYAVIEAANGGEALRAAAAHRGSIDLLLTDVVMPESGGIATAEALRGLRPALKVLYMTGYAGSLDERRISVPGTAVLSKPFSPGDLETAVRALLDVPAAGAR